MASLQWCTLWCFRPSDARGPLTAALHELLAKYFARRDEAHLVPSHSYCVGSLWSGFLCFVDDNRQSLRRRQTSSPPSGGDHWLIWYAAFGPTSYRDRRLSVD